MNNLYERLTTFLKSYVSEFSLKSSIFYLIVLAFYLGINSLIPHLLSNNILFVFSHLKASLWIDLILAIITVYSLHRLLVTLFIEYLLPTINSIALTTVLTFAFLYDKQSENYQYLTSYITDNIQYIDVIFFNLIVYSFEFKSYKKTLAKQKPAILEDSAYDSDDAFSREIFIDNIASLINESSTIENSYGIGIIGKWGSGKTNFLRRLQRKLQMNDSENEILEFNPWKVNKPEAMIDDFFIILSKHLKKYNKSIGNSIKKYSKQLFQNSKNIEHRLVDTLIRINEKEETLDNLYQSINTSILNTGKRLIIFIDDLDRLTSTEVIEVLRIIRNTGNFSNTFYVVALDYSYIIKTLNKSALITDSEEYLKKIFQLTITLPVYRKKVIVEQLKKLLIDDSLTEREQQQLLDVIKNLSFDLNDYSYKMFPGMNPETYIETMLDNLRDVKRFVNGFKIPYNLVKDDVSIRDLFILELIKHKNIEVYNNLANRSLLNFDTNHSQYFILDDNNWKKYADENKESNIVEHTKKILDLILVRPQSKTARNFAFADNFYLYFSYQLFNLISINEFNTILKQDYTTILSRFKEFEDNEQQDNLIEILSVYSSFNTREEFLKYCTILLMYSPKNNVTLLTAFDLLFTKAKYYSHRFYDPNDLEKDQITQYKENILNNILQNKKIDDIKKARLLNQLLTPFVYKSDEKNDEYIYSKIELQNMILELFDNYLNDSNSYNESVYNFLMLNDSHREGEVSRIRLYPPALKRMRQFLQSDNKIGEDFIYYFIRPAFTNHSGQYAFEPFADDVFETKENLKHYIECISSQRDIILNLKTIILGRFDELYQDERKYTFKATPTEESIIIPHLQSLGLLPSNPVAASIIP